MEAIFFGNCSGDQPGPCIRADLENGMYALGLLKLRAVPARTEELGPTAYIYECSHVLRGNLKVLRGNLKVMLMLGRYQWGGNTTIPKVNDSTALSFPFTSLYLRGRTDGFMMKGGDATKGKLKTMWDGPRPNTRPDPKGGQCSYQPMRKQGAIILGKSTGQEYPRLL